MTKFFRNFLFLVFSLFFFASCQKIDDDKIPPVLILNGSNPATVLLGCNYNDPGYLVKDDKTEEVPVNTSGTVNTDSAGVYYIEYTAVDADSNKAFARRKVIVEPLNIDIYEGSFSVFDTLIAFPKEFYNYNVTIDLFNQNPKIYRIKNFNNFGDHFRVLFEPDSTGSFQLDYINADTIIAGSGYPNCDYSGFRIQYTVETPDEPIYNHHATFK